MLRYQSGTPATLTVGRQHCDLQVGVGQGFLQASRLRTGAGEIVSTCFRRCSAPDGACLVLFVSLPSTTCAPPYSRQSLS